MNTSRSIAALVNDLTKGTAANNPSSMFDRTEVELIPLRVTRDLIVPAGAVAMKLANVVSEASKLRASIVTVPTLRVTASNTDPSDMMVARDDEFGRTNLSVVLQSLTDIYVRTIHEAGPEIKYSDMARTEAARNLRKSLSFGENHNTTYPKTDLINAMLKRGEAQFLAFNLFMNLLAYNVNPSSSEKTIFRKDASNSQIRAAWAIAGVLPDSLVYAAIHMYLVIIGSSNYPEKFSDVDSQAYITLMSLI